MGIFGRESINSSDIPDDVILPLRKEKGMNLKDWEKLSFEEQQEYFKTNPGEAKNLSAQELEKNLFHASPGDRLRLQSERGKPDIAEKADCSDGLLELRNQLKREIDDELNASRKYKEASVKMLAHGHGASAYHLKKISEQEHMHSYMLRHIVDIITEDCGE